MFMDGLTGNYLSTADGRLLDCNPAFLRIFGYSSTEEAMASDLAHIHRSPEDRAAFVALVAEKKRLEYHEMEGRRVDGTPLFLVENVVGTFDAAGQLVALKGFVFDDTRRRTLESQLRQ